ncbi:MAG: cytochrome c oxidase assembly protein [Sphingomonas bacterium]|uniref:cytochrome c oxidase assembly protein n=1 Tax=Sphingomonas bacterium TaxID=1895847 RepID=UPI00262EEB29|nr:cytochrome c oxidase assembly protein [Sphingomonas bacterium]MDB5703445.1 cytochrome c oxidase assembly protein [Sphingomonas bacterium]
MRAVAAAGIGGILLLAPGAALAHDGHGDPLPGWTWDPWITVPIAISALLFAVGLTRLSARAGQSGFRKRAILFGIGWATLAAALVSPLHEAGERSFAAHMFEHELIMLAAAPFLILSEPLAIMLWAFPPSGRQAIGTVVRARPVAFVWRRLTTPVTATLVQAATLWLWHAPLLFDLALGNEGWHAAQHLSFVLSALLFWSAMLGARSQRTPGGRRGLAALCLFATSLVSGALGALMAFSVSPWYAGYARLGMAPFGLTSAEDQQLAGLIMWVPGGLVHAVAALALVAGMLGHQPAKAAAHAA